MSTAGGTVQKAEILFCLVSCLYEIKMRFLFLILVNVIVATEPMWDPICGFIAATNIESIYSEWSCFPNGSSVTSPCSQPNWRGLDCEGKGTVRILFLKNNSDLMGTLSPDIGRLQDLHQLKIVNTKVAGSIPATFGLLTNIRELVLRVNFLTGSIPSEFGSLTNIINGFSLATNCLSGTIPSALIAFSSKHLDLAGNKFTGSLPPLTGCGYFQVRDNLFTGDFPSMSASNVTNIFAQNNFFGPTVGVLPTTIRALNFANNLLSGSLPSHICQLTHLISLEASNNKFHGSLPACLSSLQALEYLVMFSNHLEGSVSPLAKLPILKVVSISSNFFNGNLNDHIKTSSALLEAVSVADNFFSGSLPYVLFRNNTHLKSLVASKNCFTGSWSDDICDAAALESLALAGLASNCQKKWLGSVIGASELSGSIPSCLFGLAHLTRLAIDGNGARGRLVDLPANSSLQAFSASCNQLEGSIPISVLQLPTVRIPYNRLSGTIDHFHIDSSQNVTLSNNRLSGAILPVLNSSSATIGSVNVLEGNRFACAPDLFSPTRNLPSNDAHFAHYVCGSYYLEISLIFVVSFLLVVFVGLIWRWKHQLLILLKELWKPKPNPALQDLNNLMQICRKLTFMTMLVTILFMTPVYSGLAEFSTHAYRYMWEFSLVYLEGTLPAVVISITWCVCLAISIIPIPAAEHPKSSQCEWFNLRAMTVVIVDFVVLLACNGGYVYVALTQNSFWTNVASVILLLVKVVLTALASQLLFVSIESLPRVQSSRFVLAVNFINYFLAPLVANMFVDPSCFQHVFIAPAAVNFDYEYSVCIFRGVAYGSVCDTGVMGHSLEVEPSFIYGYQCSSSLVLNYVPLFMITYGVVWLLIPTFQMCLLWSNADNIISRCKAFSGVILDESVMPIIDGCVVEDDDRLMGGDIRVSQIDEGGMEKKRPFFHNPMQRFSCNVVVALGVMLTYGVAFPLLNVLVCGSMWLQSFVLEAAMARHYCQLEGCHGSGNDGMRLWCDIIKEEVVFARATVRSAIGIMIVCVLIFYPFFLWDMTQNLAVAFYVELSLVLFVVVFRALYLQSVKERRTQVRGGEPFILPFNILELYLPVFGRCFLSLFW